MMVNRLDYRNADSKALKGLLEIEKFVARSNLKRSLRELVKLRVSQINGCSYCIGMHTTDALENGEIKERINALRAWRKTTLFSERERAALAWTEAQTGISEKEISDSLYQTVRGYFSEEELIALTMAIIAINGWNRLVISFGAAPGTSGSRKKENPNKSPEVWS